MIDLNSSMSVSRKSNSVTKETSFNPSVSPHVSNNFNTTTAKEFRNVLKLSIKKKQTRSDWI